MEGKKELLVSALDALIGKLGDIYFTASHQQHDEDHSIEDAEWARLEQRGEDAISEIYPALVLARSAMTAFLEANQQESAAIDAQLRKFDRGLLSAR
jgi:Spy/CpxP family protein refolding chaperone